MNASVEQRMVAVMRDCPARAVPSGTPITLPKNAFVTITQARGGNYTVSHRGNLARVDGTDADALGLEVEELDFGQVDEGAPKEEHVWETLRTIYDPEIPVNIVDLGLIYGVQITEKTPGHDVVNVTMTLTSPTCGMGQVLANDVRYRLKKVPNVDEVIVDLVFDPPWSRDNISEEAQLELGIF
ncbi:MAG: putative Fe-S cluster assembly protein SufT [Pseudomonadales bacterium]|nr:putative Fe-S cluster assembly protein SufT [Pseudomonadales bacterium]